EKYDDVTISFMDIVNFTEMSTIIGAERLVTILNDLFTEFDRLTDGYRIEKIKTIGDAYMVAAGLPERYEDNCEEMMKFIIQAMALVKNFNIRNNTSLQIRVGMHCGSVVAGVIGKKKFIYDIWGATVNFASRLETYSFPDRIQVSEKVFQKLQDIYEFERRDSVAVKGVGVCTCYLLKNDTVNQNPIQC
nr:adenylate/guanylate cyclase domain-containing protein [Treponema sp.]